MASVVPVPAWEGLSLHGEKLHLGTMLLWVFCSGSYKQLYNKTVDFLFQVKDGWATLVAHSYVCMFVCVCVRARVHLRHEQGLAAGLQDVC